MSNDSQRTVITISGPEQSEAAAVLAQSVAMVKYFPFRQTLEGALATVFDDFQYSWKDPEILLREVSCSFKDCQVALEKGIWPSQTKTYFLDGKVISAHRTDLDSRAVFRAIRILPPNSHGDTSSLVLTPSEQLVAAIKGLPSHGFHLVRSGLREGLFVLPRNPDMASLSHTTSLDSQAQRVLNLMANRHPTLNFSVHSHSGSQYLSVDDFSRTYDVTSLQQFAALASLQAKNAIGGSIPAVIALYGGAPIALVSPRLATDEKPSVTLYPESIYSPHSGKSRIIVDDFSSLQARLKAFDSLIAGQPHTTNRTRDRDQTW